MIGDFAEQQAGRPGIGPPRSAAHDPGVRTQDPNQPDYGQPPQYPYGGQPPPYGTPAQPGYGPPAPTAGGYVADPPGYYMGRALANWPQRVGAYLIDDLIAGIPAFTTLILFSGSTADETASAGAVLWSPSLLYLLRSASGSTTARSSWDGPGRAGASRC